MRKTKLPKRELDICERLRVAREWLGLTQQAVASQIGIERSSLANYECGRSPVKHDLALKFCHQLILNEEWIATGKMSAAKAEANRRGLNISADKSLDSIFRRQSMDLVVDPICRRIPPGMLFSESYDKFLASRYDELIKTFFHAPRIIYAEGDPPERSLNILTAYFERWLKLLGNEALAREVSQAKTQAMFTTELIKSGGQIFTTFIQSGMPKKAPSDLAESVNN